MGRYKHDYTDGDIVTDLKYKEIFIFSDRTDGYRAEITPDELRIATQQEKQILQECGETCIELI